MTETVVYRRLLDANIDLSPVCRGTVNHLPMALSALHQMGASDDQMIAFDRTWRDRHGLPAVGSQTIIAADAWPDHLGRIESFAALAAAFDESVRRGQARGLTIAILQRLYPGISTMAFHALIRLAYGIDAAHSGEIAAGLALLVAGYAEIEFPDPLPQAFASVGQGLDAVADAVGGRRFGPGMITTAMANAAKDEQFRKALSPAPVNGPTLLPEMSRAAAQLYVQSGDFTILHMVTAVHAARVVFSFAPELVGRPLADALWLNYLTAYASVGAPKLQTVQISAPIPDWPELLQAACAKSDDHAVKLTHTCRAEFETYGGDIYRAAAARVLKLSNRVA